MEQIAVIGLGYVGLPVAMALDAVTPRLVGYDRSAARVEALRRGRDVTDTFTADELAAAKIEFTTDPDRMRGCTFFIVTVPTPIDEDRRPDLTPLRSASEALGRVIAPGAVVVFESTVYPGVTEEVCGPIIAHVSGLKQGVDFKLGYSPERINPGDTEHTFERITKVVSGEDEETLERVATVYGGVVKAGVHRASSIRVAEAAKVIENTQRDLNIALMNELALIFDRMGISTHDVLQAAGTKWNFLRFSPGLVGGHCIGVDPYYLAAKAEQIGFHPEVILAGRRVNDGMGPFLAERLVKLMINADVTPIKGARVGILGLTFKENVPDLRNSRVPDIIGGLGGYGVRPLVHDPTVTTAEAEHEYGVSLSDLSQFRDLDALVLAVSHREYVALGPAVLAAMVRPGGVLMDVKSALNPAEVGDGVVYWSL
jgi:UDP-N-acetyl-D-galactosamine dehydrogenase